MAARSFENTKLLADASLMCWVLMPDHVHWLIQLGDNYDLGTIISRLKSGSSRAVNRSLHRKGAVWEAAYYDRCVRKEEDIRVIARYVVANPLRAGLVKHIGQYPFWNAAWM